ncbi:MAG: Arginyl-tRNA synthetase [Candidatus Methanohalarchaeum thermophilum]|uniref:Arginine--tRNA ligase n=1 Tax=Methanohalarchaeum thermophilum TaxID=1903181 RepID=A0A1Q6DV49_METT1|nr:MAG: Arginyl-tRNA synthetase [Candidatus Methanohalarchaeum thermophilum]
MFLKFKKEVTEVLEDSLNELDLDVDDLGIEEPRDIADLASTLPFSISSILGEDPSVVGEKIVAKIDLGELKYISDVKFKEPGYINFYVDEGKLRQMIFDILEEPKKFMELEDKDEKIILEHTSANPTGPLHIGHLRNALIGDTLARILERAGYSVETQYYLNDLGRQMALLLLGVRKFGLQKSGKGDHEIGELYKRSNNFVDDSDEGDIELIMQKFEQGDEDVLDELDSIVNYCFEGIQKTLSRLNIKHDQVVKESKFVEENRLSEVIDSLEPNLEESDGSLQLNFQDMDKELVLKRSDGTSVYALRDLAYHKWKNKRGSMLDILGADHKLYSKQLVKALELMDIDSPEIIIFEFVSLPEGGMSKRKGQFISADELIDKVQKAAFDEVSGKRQEKNQEWKEKIADLVARGAIRYDFIKVAPKKPIKFNIKKAVDLNEQGAPFIQYSFARATSILDNSDLGSISTQEIDSLDNERSKELLKLISKMPSELKKAAEKKRPHYFAEYVFELASKFNEFYRDVPVLQAGNANEKKARLLLVRAFKLVMEEAINILGFEAPEEM